LQHALIITGKNDPIVPPVNGQFLADRLPNNRHLVLDAEHRIWEEASDKYIETLVSWFGGDYNRLEKRRDNVLRGSASRNGNQTYSNKAAKTNLTLCLLIL